VGPPFFALVFFRVKRQAARQSHFRHRVEGTCPRDRDRCGSIDTCYRPVSFNSRTTLFSFPSSEASSRRVHISLFPSEGYLLCYRPRLDSIMP
jgi:hypothetical protein